MSTPLSLRYLWCTTVLHHGSLIMASPLECDKAHQGKRNRELSLGDVCLKASSPQMDLRRVAARGVIDICSISGKDVDLALWKIQLDQSSCFIWTQES